MMANISAIFDRRRRPAMTYSAEVALTDHAKDKLAAAQTKMEKMERRILNITYRNICVKVKTNVTDVTEQVRRRTRIWAGHVSEIRD